MSRPRASRAAAGGALLALLGAACGCALREAVYDGLFTGVREVVSATLVRAVLGGG